MISKSAASDSTSHISLMIAGLSLWKKSTLTPAIPHLGLGKFGASNVLIVHPVTGFFGHGVVGAARVVPEPHPDTLVAGVSDQRLDRRRRLHVPVRVHHRVFPAHLGRPVDVR